MEREKAITAILAGFDGSDETTPPKVPIIKDTKEPLAAAAQLFAQET